MLLSDTVVIRCGSHDTVVEYRGCDVCSGEQPKLLPESRTQRVCVLGMIGSAFTTVGPGREDWESRPRRLGGRGVVHMHAAPV